MLKLIIYPDPILQKIAEPVTEFNDELGKTIEEMYVVMHSERGIGLAAPQVGLSKRLFVMTVNGVQSVFINPEISKSHGESSIDEGCLSFPDIRVRIRRFSILVVKFQDMLGKDHQATLKGLESICFQHELDHLNGKNLIDYLPNSVQSYIIKRFEREKERYGQERS